MYGGLHYGARWLPLPVLHGISLVGNSLAVTLMRETLEGIRENFRLALGVPEPEARRLARRLFFEYGRSVIDVWRLRSEAFVPKITSFDADAAVLAGVRKNGRGFLLVTGHVGNWEMGAVTLRGHALTPAVVGQPELDPDVEAMRLSLRTRLGVESIDIGSSMATAFRVRTAVEAGRAVALLVDRAYPEDQVVVSYFGRPTPFLRSPALLARFCRCEILPGFFLRSPDGSYFNVWGAPHRRRRDALSRGGRAPHHEPRGRRSGRRRARAPDAVVQLLPVLEGRERFGRSGGGPAGVRRARPRAVDVVSAAPAADGERLSRELFAEAAGALPGPDLPERRLPHVADEVIGKVPAEADLAVRLDLGEVPGHRAEVVAEGLRPHRRSSRARLPPGTSGTNEIQGRPRAESRKRRRRRPFRSFTSCVSWRPFVTAKSAPSNSNPFQELPETPKVSDITFSYSAPVSFETNQRSPMLTVSSGSSRSSSSAGATSSRLSSVIGRMARSIGAADPSSSRTRATALTPAAARSKLSACPADPVVDVGRAVDGDHDRVHAGLDELAGHLLEPPAVRDDASTSGRAPSPPG